MPIVNLVILGDERATWRPGAFQSAKWGCEVDFRFPIVKLLDYEAHWADLEASPNPFAIVVMAHLKTKETRKDFAARREWKFRLTRMLYERDYSRQDILNIYRFLDWILESPDELKQRFRDDLKRYEEEKQMPYVTSIERMGIAEGLEQGRQEERALILRLLTRRVRAVPKPLIDRISKFPIEQLESLAEALLDFTQLDDLTQWLAIDR